MNVQEKLNQGYYKPESHGFVWNENRKAYREKGYQLAAEFRKDVIESVGLTDHPKAEAFYQKAWEDGHSSGLQEVLNILEELVELFA